MSTPQFASVELIQDARSAQGTGPAGWRRWKVFFGVLLLATAIGLVIVYSRAPVYRAAASVLTVKPKAVDSRSADADIEHVAIQGRLLLGEELLGRVSERLSANGDDAVAGVDRLRSMLSVTPVPDTNLLELRAEGESPEQLQRAVNRWAESYEGFRLEEIEAATGRTSAELEEQQARLLSKIDAARAELLAYRQAHDIVSLERTENRSLATLKGLNDSLNKARERLIEATARKTAVDEAIARGETVIPDAQKAEITNLQLDVQSGRARLADLKQRYTERYIERDPDLRAFPEVVRELENELALAVKLAKQTVSDEARQELDAARASVRALEQQLAEHQNEVQLFTDRFKEFTALEEGLAGLERLVAENKERLAQIQVQNLQKYPPIQVVEWARVPSQPIYPDYNRDLMIALASALGLALFVTWLVEYLSERARPGQTSPWLGVRVYPGGPQTLDAPTGENRLAYAHATPASLASPASHQLPMLPRELSTAEITTLLTAAEPLTAGCATLLLGGVSPSELPLLGADDLDRTRGLVGINGANRREVPMSPAAWNRLEPLLEELQGGGDSLSLTELDSRLADAARAAQLADPASVNALALWHTYVVFLVRQGIDAYALARRAGAIPADLHGALAHFAPPGGNRPLDSINFIHPALAS